MKNWELEDMDLDAATISARNIVELDYDPTGFEHAYNRYDMRVIFDMHGYYLNDLIESVLDEVS